MNRQGAGNMPLVVAAMSGGVDSSVAAALLVQQGYTVVGMMLRLWSEPGEEGANRCCTPDDMALARRVAGQLGIPFYAVDVRETFRKEVVEAFIEGYRLGNTPNPCMRCNRHIRWGFLLEQAKAIGASALATGHYARVSTGEDGHAALLKGVDPAKDQSYILSVLNQEQLRHTHFPLGGLTKPEVRHLARQFDLPVSEKSDSQDLCFLGKQDYRQFLARHAPDTAKQGKIINRAGVVLGTHQGLAGYTIGQRKGLGIAAPAPFYVLEKDLDNNVLVVGAEEELGRTWLETGPFNWLTVRPPVSEVKAEVKIRYKSRLAQACLLPQPDGSVKIRFEHKLRDITPGQLAVAYEGERVMGSGVILRAGRD